MTEEAFNRGLSAYLNGANNADDLKKTFPRLSKVVLAKLAIEYREIVSAGHRAVINQLETRQSEIDGRDAVGAIDTRVSSANAALLYTIARVAAARDGYN